MKNLLYKKNLIEKKYKDRENYSLKREDPTFQIYYNIKVNAKYGQIKFLISSNDAKALIVGSYVEGPGLFDGVFIKRLEKNNLMLSRPVLSYGNIVLTFKCKLSTGDKWLDWSKDTWREKINEAQRIFPNDLYKNQSSYFLKVKNYYESRCPYPIETYFVREKDVVETIDKLYCGQSFVNTYNIEQANCGEDARSAGNAFCGNTHSDVGNVESAACGEDAKVMGNTFCGNSHNQTGSIEELGCEELQIFVGERTCNENSK